MKTLRITEKYPSDFRIAFMGFGFLFVGLFVLIAGIIKRWYFGYAGVLVCVGLIGSGIIQIRDYYKDKSIKTYTHEIEVLNYKEIK